MGLLWAVIALGALQALAALAVQPTVELSREPNEGKSISNLQDGISRYLKTADDSLESQVAALQETLEDVVECWGQRRRRRRRRRRPTPAPPSDGDESSSGDGGGDSTPRRRRQAPSPQGEMHFSGDGNIAVSGQRYMSIGGNSGTDVIGQTLGRLPKMIGQGINAATGVFGGNAKGGQNGPMGSSSEPSAGTGFLGKIPGMATQVIGGGGGSLSGSSTGTGSGGFSSWFSGGSNNMNQGMGRPNGPVGGPNVQGQGTGFFGQIPGISTHMSGVGGGLSSGGNTGASSGGIFSWFSRGSNNMNQGMGRPNGPVGGPNMQGQGTGFPGNMSIHTSGGSGGFSSGSLTGTGLGGISSWFSGGNNRNQGMGDHKRPDGGRSGSPGMGVGGGLNIHAGQSKSFLEKVPGIGGVFSAMGGREKTGGPPVHSLSGTTKGMGEGNGGLRSGGSPRGHVGNPRIQVDGHGRGNYQGGEAAVNFEARMKSRGTAPRAMGEASRGAGDMEQGGQMSTSNIGGQSRGAGDRGQMPQANGHGHPGSTNDMQTRGTSPPANKRRHSQGMGDMQSQGQKPQRGLARRLRGAGPTQSSNMGGHPREAGGMEQGGQMSSPNMGGQSQGAGVMEPRRQMPQANRGRHSQGAGDIDPMLPPNRGRHSQGKENMAPRRTMPPVNMETGGSAETATGEQSSFSRPSSRRHKRTAGNQRDIGRNQHSLNGKNSKESFETTSRTEPKGGRRGSDSSQKEEGKKRDVCSGRSKRAVPERSTSISENGRGRGASRQNRSRTRSQKSSRNGSGRSPTRGRGETGRRTASSSAASSGARVKGWGKGVYSFSSSSMSSDDRGTFQSGGGVIGRAPSIQTGYTS